MSELISEPIPELISEPEPRRAGVLLHPTSLPGPFGVGDLGPEADRFLDWLVDAGQRVWQILPLGPPGDGGSPYSALSSFAGNPLLISPERLAADGLLDRGELEGAKHDGVEGGASGRVDFPAAAAAKAGLLRRAFERFDALRGELRDDHDAFLAAKEQHWLDDWTLFAALGRRHPDRGFWDWPAELARREPEALDAARRELAREIAFEGFVQFQFFRQWRRVREAAHRRGIELFGDLPIYVARMSAEVWTRPDLFDLDDNLRPRAVAGVPPDYFSATGQLWGNPLYRWDRLAAEGYAWWAARLAAQLRLVDRLRLDHFRAFAAYWRIPASAETAVTGEWVDGPGDAFFEALRQRLGELPLVAEDLGEITPDVLELRDRLGLAGMRVLQFGLADPGSLHAPHHHTPRSVAYTGTHDNDTSVGWYRGLAPEARRRVRESCGLPPDEGPGGCERDLHWHLIRLAYASVAELAIVPVQDVLGRGSEARLNTPGEAAGQWGWRLTPGELGGDQAAGLCRLTELTDRSRIVVLSERFDG